MCISIASAVGLGLVICVSPKFFHGQSRPGSSHRTFQRYCLEEETSNGKFLGHHGIWNPSWDPVSLDSLLDSLLDSHPLNC